MPLSLKTWNSNFKKKEEKKKQFSCFLQCISVSKGCRYIELYISMCECWVSPYPLLKSSLCLLSEQGLQRSCLLPSASPAAHSWSQKRARLQFLHFQHTGLESCQLITLQCSLYFGKSKQSNWLNTLVCEESISSLHPDPKPSLLLLRHKHWT